MMPMAQVCSAPPSARARTRPLVILEVGLILILSALAVWKGIIPAWRILNTDFPNYYVAARLIRAHYCLDRLYDWIWFQRIAGKFGISHQLVGFLGLTPFSALPIVPLSWLPVLEAKRIWIICNVVLLATGVYLLARQSGLSYRTACLIALCAVIPLRTSFLFGQMHILVLLLLAAAYAFHMRGRQIGSGCCIAIAAVLKVYPVFFCIYFLIKRRWKALGAALAAMALCLLLSCILTGPEAMRAYFFQQLPRSLQGESGNPFLSTLTSSSALFHRLFLYEPDLNPHPLIISPSLYALLYPLWQAFLAGIALYRMRGGFRADEREALEWSMFLCLLMFLSSAPASYQYVAVIAAAVPTVSILLNQRRWPAAAAVYLSLYIASCNATTMSVDGWVTVLTPLLYVKLWCGVALIVFYCVLLKPLVADRHTSAGKLLMWPTARAFAVVICLWIPAAASAWFHVSRARPEDRMVADVSDAAYMKTGPVATDAGVAYLAMLRRGYRVLSTNEASFVNNQAPRSADELSFATTRSGKDVWIEEASAVGSRIVHVVEKSQTPSVAIDDAETPALSGDESLLAFVREDHGHGSLWIIDLRKWSGPGSSNAPVKVTSESFDVRSVAAGAGNTFLVSAVSRGRESIFVAEDGLPPQLLAQGNGPLDSPAISPDGKVLAVRELIAERWQLVSLDLSSHMWKQLTHGDCNAYTPSWKDDHTLLYATDCMRGMGLATLASLTVDR